DRRHERLLPPTAAPRRYCGRTGLFPRVGDARSIHFWTDPRPGKRLRSSTRSFKGIDVQRKLSKLFGVQVCTANACSIVVGAAASPVACAVCAYPRQRSPIQSLVTTRV